MVKKAVKEELKKQDVVLSSLQKWKEWAAANIKICIIGVIVVILLGLGGWAFASYRSSRNDQIQYKLTQAIRNFQEYTLAGKSDSLPKAETGFKEVMNEGRSGPGAVAGLYLAKIALLKGNKEEAKTIYDRLSKKPANDVIKKLADAGLKGLEKTK